MAGVKAVGKNNLGDHMIFDKQPYMPLHQPLQTFGCFFCLFPDGLYIAKKFIS